MAVADFLAATLRHADDARRLREAGRPDNAAYLAGYTIECGLKVLVEAYAPGMAVALVHDLEKLETLALAATVAHVETDRIFPTKAVAVARNLGWEVAWRYVPDGTVPEAAVDSLLEAANAMVEETLFGAMLDGKVIA